MNWFQRYDSSYPLFPILNIDNVKHKTTREFSAFHLYVHRSFQLEKWCFTLTSRGLWRWNPGWALSLTHRVVWGVHDFYGSKSWILSENVQSPKAVFGSKWYKVVGCHKNCCEAGWSCPVCLLYSHSISHVGKNPHALPNSQFLMTSLIKCKLDW